MKNESQLQSNADSMVQNMYGKYDVQYRLRAPAALCNFATATTAAFMPDQSMPTMDLSRDLVNQVTIPNYGYKNQTKKISPVFSKRQQAALLIKDCQLAFSDVMHAIGNTATKHQKQKIGPAVAPGERYSSELSTEIRTILDRQMPITEFGMRWEPDFQVFYGAGKIFANAGVTNTVPTHDLAHLLIGACGNLEWCPEGEHEEVRLAEYYAVFIENLFDKVYGHMAQGSYKHDTVLNETIAYMRWFVDVHYSPFPIPAEEAYRRFCWNMDVAAIVRLSPLFFALKHVERTITGYRDQIWEMHFNTEDAPLAEQVAAICADGPLS
ncbi:hypothetical protein [Solimicrobium silvestre]|uniref:Uncharacterized protein n=1 Tax=Solimicrobium silvestre TaxID=2099400 RepID=A0A2S9H325_9BURK|nr:hypothetical protein [Solimicrobium silvestre]PRC94357.1 hypothetical protein S2091_0978 [Solimicrobium silvestre]